MRFRLRVDAYNDVRTSENMQKHCATPFTNTHLYKSNDQSYKIRPTGHIISSQDTFQGSFTGCSRYLTGRSQDSQGSSRDFAGCSQDARRMLAGLSRERFMPGPKRNRRHSQFNVRLSRMSISTVLWVEDHEKKMKTAIKMTILM